MSIANVDTAAIGSAIARNGIEASIANSRGPETFDTLVNERAPKIKAATEGSRPGRYCLQDGDREKASRRAGGL